MQWQQLVAEHEAKKQMQQNMGPALTAPLCRSAPSTPGAVDQTAPFVRPGTKMTVQGKPAMMVPPVAPPRTPQRARSSRMASTPARGNFIDSKSPVFIPMNSGQTMYGGPPNGPYDSSQPQMNYGFPAKQQQSCPRYMNAMAMGAGMCDSSAMNDPMFQAQSRQYGGIVTLSSSGLPEPQMMDPNATYGMMAADVGYMDAGFVNSPPNPYLQYQQQQHNPGAVDLNDYPPGSVIYNQMNPNLMQHMGPANPELNASNLGQQTALPMVNNTYVNATMSIQQVNIQNVSPFPPGTGVISVQSGQGPSMNGHQNYSGARFVSPVQKSAATSNRGASYSKQQRPSFTPSDSFSNAPSQFPMDIGSNNATSSGFLSGYAEPLTNLESKVPSQKLQYFPDPSQQQSQFSSGPQYCVSDAGCMPPQIMQCNLIQQQQQPPQQCLEAAGFVHGVPPHAYSVAMQGNDMNAMKRGSTQMTRFAAAPAYLQSPPNTANRDNVYQMQFHNFQQQLYATSVRRNEGNLT
ncbi:unnamed protein product [Soboliphyme baturini]|uniref:Zinc finger MIZ domain-containing protein 1 n=1 Tax=Soboliphyme baturini TaxID=241478 RepID=A0A183J7R6_9BILA|nr:unnamed protein product [Soboliphyme baturini]